MTREELFQWVKQEYGTEAEYPWKDSNAVLRRADNDKWYGVILSVAGSKLGLDEPIKNLLALSYELTAPKKKKNTSK